MPKSAASVLYRPYAVETVNELLASLPDPDLILQAKGIRRHELRKLETDDEITAVLETRREAVIATPWRLEPFEGEAAEWLSEELTPHMESLLRGVWSAVPYGYSVLEVVYRKDGGRVGVSHISEKPIEWFQPTRDGQLILTLPEKGEHESVDLKHKFLLTRRNPTYRNPFGESLLSRAYWPWFFRHNGWRFWMNFLERFSDPLLMGKVYNPQDFVAAMQNLGLETVVGVGKDEDITAVTQSAAGEFERVEHALINRIQRLVLGQTLTSNVGDSGSYAAAKVHEEVRDDKRRADLRLVTNTAQRLIDSLWWLNNFAGDAPSFLLQDDTGLELERAERDSKLAKAGILKFTDQYLLDKYDLEAKHFEIPETKQPEPNPFERPKMDGEEGLFTAKLAANGQRFSPDQEMIEDLISNTIRRSRSPISKAKISKAILSAKDPQDLAEKLAKVYQGNDTTEFRELLERALFMADVTGYVTAEKRIGVRD